MACLHGLHQRKPSSPIPTFQLDSFREPAVIQFLRKRLTNLWFATSTWRTLLHDGCVLHDMSGGGSLLPRLPEIPPVYLCETWW
jgi:hypothetical protein